MDESNSIHLQMQPPTVYTISGQTATDSWVCFDLDWTLVRPIKGKFPRTPTDYAFLPHRIDILYKYQQAGSTVVIFTNQNVKQYADRLDNIVTDLNQAGIYPWLFAATAKDKYRKPNIGLWTLAVDQLKIDPIEAFYVGDAAGRPQDYSDSDRQFANNIGLHFYTPEEIFPSTDVYIPTEQTLFIFVGMPGSGKTTFYQNHLQGWMHVNQDTLKTRAKMRRTVDQGLKEGKSVAVDATNPTAAGRKEYIDLAVKYQVPTLIIYFVQNGFGWNKLRDKPVPSVAYNVYFKRLEEPTLELDRVPVVEV